MRQIFLSYARVESERARKLFDALRDSPDVKVWFDKEDLLPGMRWEPAILKAIRESRYFVAVMSKESVEGPGYRNTELSAALEKLKKFGDYDIFLIPTRLDDCDPPFEEMRKLDYADLFPDWTPGVERLRKAMRIKTAAGTRFTSKKSQTAGIRKKSAKKKAARKKGTKKKPSAVRLTKSSNVKTAGTARPISNYHYRVGLVDLQSKHPQLKSLAKKLNELQTFCHLSVSHLNPTGRALRNIGSAPHLDLDKLSHSFYNKIAPMKLDHIICMTDRLITFEEDGYIYSNYLGDSSAKDDRVYFLSTYDLDDQAKEAGVGYEFALAYGIVCDLASYFLDIGYHTAIRGCPMDFTEDHADIVKGLRKRKFCKSCSAKLDKNMSLKAAVNQLLKFQ